MVKLNFSRKVRLFVSVALVIGLALPSLAPFQIAHAQTTETVDQREARLRAELANIEKEEAETQAILNQAQAQTGSIQRDITILNAKNKAAQLDIQKKNILIQTLGKDISTKSKKIETLEERIDSGKESLAQIMRKTQEVDSYSIPEVLLAKEDLAEVLSDMDTFDAIKISLQGLFTEIREAKAQTLSEKDQLNKKKNLETDAKAQIETQKKLIERNEAEKKVLLGVSKAQEKTYAQLLAEKRQKAAEIRAALFALRDTAAIPFGTALEYANAAAKQTGIRPAFLLAILTQESALGKNVGSCYLTDPNTGAGVSVKSGIVISNVMKPTRDVPPFLTITKALGMDPYKTLISCPQSIGWGGAMGPAQFIPSTWVLFQDRIAKLVGSEMANPWRAKDAFMASAIYLTDLGAVNGSITGERNAACRYYSGASCAPGSINETYGNQVISKAYNIQENMINPLQGL